MHQTAVPLIVNFTPTGMIPTKDKVPSVPISANEIIEEVHQAYELGITLAHLHARKTDGTPSIEAADYRPILEGVRLHCPDLVICTSLSGRSVSDPMARAEVLSLRPDMGSLTLSSLNFVQQASINSPQTIQFLAHAIQEAGARPELEVFDLCMMNYLNYLISKAKITSPYYINII
ncbi:MAG: 3-keto-5-aminohexanoate cleavage protein, partial [Flavobacteriales bacterium]